MRRWIARFSAVLLALALAPAAVAGADAGNRQDDAVPGRYIVVLDRGDPRGVAAEHARRHDAAVRHVYTQALRGYAARMSEQAAGRIARDDRVLAVEPDTVERIVGQVLPTGVDRVETDRNPTVSTDGNGKQVDADIAVIDTGIDPGHPDLNVAGGRNFTAGPAGSWGDGHGHGTHVAGTIAASDNGLGVVGVAPGAPVWSVKVCGNNGRCMASDIVAGIDWVAQQKVSETIDFAAANFSISSQDSLNTCASPTNATHNAICGLVDTGVPFVMAAGNDNREKQPYPVAFSVSAIADFDGQAGGAGAPTCRNDTDDTLANFSNYGGHVDIAAPGVCIWSTLPGGGYGYMSGTSMAAPHVAGAVALYLHANTRDPAQDREGADLIKDAIVEVAHPQGTHACSYDDDRTGGPLLFTNAKKLGSDGTCGVAGQEEPPPAEPEAPTAAFSYSCNELTCGFTDESDDAKEWLWDFGDGSTSTDQDPFHTYAAEGTYTVTLTVDNEDGTDSTSADVTVTAADDDDEPTSTAVTVDGITYSTQGRWHLRVSVSVVDTDGEVGVDGASVTLTIASNGVARTGTATTEHGSATVQFNHALRDADCYTTTVVAVSGDGITWDGEYPTGTNSC